jgi:integrase|tara:strand:- start:172 stop:1938 length:1767 start_codon:yes stop_codon:yes gene_type:complete
MALTEIEFVEKLKAGTASVEEAIDFATSKPDISKNASQRIKRLRSGFEKMGLDVSMPYKDLKDENILALFTREGSPDKSNRAGNLQALENNLSKLFSKYNVSAVMEKLPGTDLEVAMYPQLAGAGTVAGTQRTGLAGERPMRGLLSMEDFTRVYAEAVPQIEAEYGQATADLVRYHATTANRPEQLQGLLKSQVTISGNTITVAGKPTSKTDKKGRPELSFDLDSPTGQLLKRNLDSSTSKYLFDTTDEKFTQAFNKHVGSRLEAFSNVLPVAEIKVETPDGIQIAQKPVITPSAIRSIVPKIMLDQFNVAEGLVQGIMGHTSSSILRRNYAGLNPATDLPKLLENPQAFAVGDFGTTPKNINIDLLSAEDKAALVEDQKLTIIEEEKARRATAGAAVAEAQAAEIKAKASVTPEEIARAAEVDEQRIVADEERRIREREIRKGVRASKLDPTGDTPEGKISDSSIQKLKDLGLWDKLSKRILLPAAITTSAVIASREAEAQGDSELMAAVKGVGAGASELLPPGYAFSDREFRESQRATTPGGSGLGPRTDVAPQTDALGYIKPEFASYPMEDAPRQSFLDTEPQQP